MLCCGGKSKPESARQTVEKLDLPKSKVSLKFSNDLSFQLDDNNEWSSSINRKTFENNEGDRK